MKKLLSPGLLLFSIICFLSLVACGGNGDDKNETQKLNLEEKTQLFSWDNIPVYIAAKLESTKDCPPQWAACRSCEHRIYSTDASPENICSFYKDEMAKSGWEKLVFQSYPEGSCMGTWMADNSNTKVLITIAKRGGNKKTFIAITLGNKCP